MRVDSQAGFAHRILCWFDQHARVLPWRLAPGLPLPRDDPDWPYRVWLSEIMLQQTSVTAVKPYFATFTTRWPSVHALAAAEDADVMAAWAGLGYYARARNLLACARVVSTELGGHFPQTEAELRQLPGIGAYTAAAVAAIAFGARAVVVDGNIERVIARHQAVATPLPAAKPELYARTDALTPATRAGDFAQAMMDLGATICTPRSPACAICPVQQNCAGQTHAEAFPVRAAKRVRPRRTGVCWWIEHDGAVLLVERPARGLLGGMRALPGCDWSGVDAPDPVPGAWVESGAVEHVFTHFSLALRVRKLVVPTRAATALAGEWWGIDRLAAAGLPSLFAKAAKAVLEPEKH